MHIQQRLENPVLQNRLKEVELQTRSNDPLAPLACMRKDAEQAPSLLWLHQLRFVMNPKPQESSPIHQVARSLFGHGCVPASRQESELELPLYTLFAERMNAEEEPGLGRDPWSREFFREAARSDSPPTTSVDLNSWLSVLD